MKREPETLCLQAVEPHFKWNRVLFVERSGRVTVTGKVKHLRCGAEGKPSLNRALSQ